MSFDPTIQPSPRAVPTEPTAAVGHSGGDNADKFAKMVQPESQSATAGVAGAAPTQAPTAPVAEPSLDSIKQLANDTHKQIGELSQAVQSPDAKLGKAERKLLMKKLPKIHEAIRTTAKQVGIDPGPKLTPSKDQSILERALTFLTQGESQLGSINKRMDSMGAPGNQISTAKMLQITTQLNSASQQIQLCTALVGSGISAVRQLLQVQV